MLLAVATDLPRIIFVGEEGNLMPELEIRRGKN
jgi:hypothetical protein